MAAAVLFLIWIGSSVPRNARWTEPADGILIMVETNGIHTAIVMPLVSPQKDWRGDFPITDIARADRPYTHLSLSWGEKTVFLDTPTWSDLSPMAAARAATGGDALVHAAFYVRPAPSETARVVRLRPAEYARLVHAIEASALSTGSRQRFPGYDDYDIFYSAPGRYDAMHTCNQWTADMLAAAGMKVGSFTPFAGGVMKWVPSPPR